MALIRCSECAKEVSDRAAACPQCGNPLLGNEADTAKDPAKPKDKRPQISTGAGCVSLIAIFAFVGWCASRIADSPPAPEVPDLTAAVRFTGTQFVITNNDSFNWSNCKLEINSGWVSGGYELRTDVIGPRSTATVGAMQFAKSDGQRFNPLSMKPNSFSITCDTPKGRLSYLGGW